MANESWFRPTKSKLWMPCTWSHFRSLTSGCDIFRLSLSRLGPRALGHHARIKYPTTNLYNSHHQQTQTSNPQTSRDDTMIYRTVICLPFFWNTVLEPCALRDNLLTPSGIESDWSFKREKCLSRTCPASGFVSIFSSTGASSARTWSRASHSEVWKD